MKSITINKNDSGQRLDKFLSKYLKRLPVSMLYKYIRIKRIKVNGKRTEISYKLCENDVVDLYINDEFFSDENADPDFLFVPCDINIIYEDENIILIDKKPSLVVHEDDENTIDTLINRVKHYLFNKGEYDPKKEQSFAPSLCNRIDRNTGGIVIVAKNAVSLRILNDKIKHREIDKKYLCIVSGNLEKKEDIMTAYLQKLPTNNMVKVYGKPNDNTKTIVTKYKVIGESQYGDIVEVSLITGRTHQIRAHFAYIGHPLVGDSKYGVVPREIASKFPYQALYSFKLTFDFKSDAEILNYLNKKSFFAENIWFLK